MPRITAEQRQRIRQSILQRYELRFGPEYRQHLHKNLIPSPIAEIAAEHQVSPYQVKKIRAEISIVGNVLRGLTTPRAGLNHDRIIIEDDGEAVGIF